MERKINNFATTGKTQSLLTAMKDDKNDIITWDQFTENTTIHGVRYIFNKTFFKLQRQVKLRLNYVNPFKTSPIMIMIWIS